MLDNYTLHNALVVSSSEKVYTGAIRVHNRRLGYTLSGPQIDLEKKSFVYPALINTHDHLRGNYLPRVGPAPGTFYLNWLPWDNDLKVSDTFAERSRLSPDEIYYLSAYKNLFSGVTTVNDHFPQDFNRKILPYLPIRAFLGYGLAHESSSYDLKWGDGIELEHERALKNEWPFITHLSEGFDEESMRGIHYLEQVGVLDDHCVLIHCIGLSDADIKKAAAAGASIVWCAASNMFMFNVTCKIRKLLQSGVNVTIGTDSTHTGSINLFAEIHYDRELYRNLYGEELPAKTLFNMVTINAARAFHMEDRLGTLDFGKMADVLILKAKTEDPFENFANATMEDIELLTMAGKPLYGEMRFMDLIGGTLQDSYTSITVGGIPRFVIGDPAGRYRQARQKIGFNKMLDFLPFEPESESS
ncbi:hydrolase [Spirochaetia bacterium]|nr:hydrolase [Spirochaetia bacterium]GHU35334.1 hydrolase [Spirochaetia bacterium]